MSERANWEFEEPSGIGDRLTVNMKEDNAAYFTVESDWAGDTVTGFGKSCSIDIPKDEALKLALALIEWARS